MTEIPLKQWFAEEAERTGKTPRAIEELFRYTDRYRDIVIRRENKRVVWVQNETRRPTSEATG